MDKLKVLSEVFAIDICAYGVQSNHYHLVLHVNDAEAQSWNINVVIERWYQLFKGLETSDYTSIQERIFSVAKSLDKAQQQVAKAS